MKFNQTPPEFTFTTRWEKLDWKKIASLDVDKLIATSNTTLLEDFSSQIAYCRPELEFALPGSEDQSQIVLDPGFLKVFRLSQLLLQYLQHLVLTSDVKLYELMKESEETAASLGKTKDELQQLRDTLTQARKELRRRKELLASAQTQALGAENTDEYDQCPYCPKKFINTTFLVSHMQRRHQGLPLNPSNPLTSLSPIRHCHRFVTSRVTQATKDTENSRSVPAASVVAVTQTEAYFGERPPSNANRSPQVDRRQVEKIVEELLLNKSSTRQDRHVQATPMEETSLAKDEVAVKNLVEEIKDQLDSHWKFISAKLDQQPHSSPKPSEVQENEGQRRLSHQLHLDTGVIETGSDVLAKSGPISPIQVHLDQKLERQSLEMEAFKLDVQAKVETEIQMMEGRLEAQERFWQSKLKQVKEEYEKQVDQVREDFVKQVKELKELQQTKLRNSYRQNGVENPMYGSTDPENASVGQIRDQQVSPIKASELPEPSYCSTPKENSAGGKQMLNRTFEVGDGAGIGTSNIPGPSGAVASTEAVVQKPKSPTKSTAQTPIPKPRSAPRDQEPAVSEPVRFIQSQPRMSTVPTKAVNEYEEPMHHQREKLVSVSSSDFSGDESSGNGHVHVFREALQPVLPEPRRTALAEAGILNEDSEPQPILSELKMSGGTEIPTIPAVLNPKELRKKKQKAADTIQSSDKLPIADVAPSPLTKLFTAVRMVKHAMVPTSRRKSPVLSVSTKSKQIKKPGIFSKARWARSNSKKRGDSDDDTQADYDFSNCSSSLKVEQHYFKRSHAEGPRSPRTPTGAAAGAEVHGNERTPVKVPRPNSGYRTRTPDTVPPEPGGFLKKNIFLVNADVGEARLAENPIQDTKYSRVRRSLLPEFEKPSPSQKRQEESTSESESEDTMSSGTELDSSLPQDQEIAILERRKESAKHQATGAINSKVSLDTEQTANRVLKMDTWDETEEDSSTFDEKRSHTRTNPVLYQQQPAGRDNVRPRPTTSMQNANIQRKARASPLNNSWDSD